MRPPVEYIWQLDTPETMEVENIEEVDTDSNYSELSDEDEEILGELSSWEERGILLGRNFIHNHPDRMRIFHLTNWSCLHDSIQDRYPFQFIGTEILKDRLGEELKEQFL